MGKLDRWCFYPKKWTELFPAIAGTNIHHEQLVISLPEMSGDRVHMPLIGSFEITFIVIYATKTHETVLFPPQ